MITTNSLGKRIAKTDEQIAAFWRWFGQSEAVDEQGRPLVVYHGTDVDFAAFDPARRGQTDTGWYGRGFYFSASQKEAARYGKHIMSVYLRLENPARFNGAVSDYVVSLAEKYNDGVIVTERPDDPPLELVVWDNRQIKSATGNRGTFDPEDPVMTNPRVSLLPAPRLSARARRGLAAGIREEMEHTRSPAAAKLIASHHLAEHARYYRELVKMERRLSRRNPKLGNTGWEFIARVDLQELSEALEREMGRAPDMDAMADVADRAFRMAVIHAANERIVPVKNYPALRHQVMQMLIAGVKSGQMRLPG